METAPKQEGSLFNPFPSYVRFLAEVLVSENR
jgi:hypothetical protein